VVHVPDAQSEWAEQVCPSRAKQTDAVHFCRLEHAEHPPQCRSSFVVFTQVPPQFVCPVGQHFPFELICPGAQQIPLALIWPCAQQSFDRHTPVPHEWSHVPQFFGSLS
jgi:hypothetical protein